VSISIRGTYKIIIFPDIIVGMDVISLGDFVITNKIRSNFTFRYPSIGGIDFFAEEQHKKKKKKYITRSSETNPPGWNKLCPCNSGKKLKVCCGRNIKEYLISLVTGTFKPDL